MNSFDSFTATSLTGEQIDFSIYKGKVILVVNTASQCGFTPQYAGLEELHQTFAPRGLAVLGFPCNQFGHQEPGDAAQIGEFCQQNYSVSFQLFEKVDVNGEHAHPLFRWLTHCAPGLLGTESIKWNFTKFLIDRNGRVAERYAPITKPEAIVADIEKLL